ncbi:hypothetical protein PPACK8108_LOCUS2105 [Phakopsora pachyrhizi]|uniref:Uncharacterized protein n=1 Tax=Phakopsora pachyrhizi TaxID=170000 RepID=A0AAV0AL38_PHAPC|nr:hypothetical protein PPACK8108_LOCUS2105 [Phakopsora pachyrhizi]
MLKELIRRIPRLAIDATRDLIPIYTSLWGQRAKEMDPNDIADESHSNIDWGVVENRDEDWIGGRSVYIIMFDDREDQS